MASSHLLFASLAVFALAVLATADYEKPTYRKAPAYIAKPMDDRYKVHIQGTIYCKKAGKLFPLPGAMARITCVALRGRGGYDSSPFSVVSKATDGNGYFKINLSAYEMGPLKFTGCRVFLEDSPPGPCSVPTNENRGISGAPLPTIYRSLGNDTRLYSIPTLVYTTLPPPAY